MPDATVPECTTPASFTKFVRNLDAQGDLCGYAAADAARCLTANWEEALGNGTYQLHTLLADVGGVIERLKEFKAAVEANDPGMLTK